MENNFLFLNSAVGDAFFKGFSPLVGYPRLICEKEFDSVNRKIIIKKLIFHGQTLNFAATSQMRDFVTTRAAPRPTFF